MTHHLGGFWRLPGGRQRAERAPSVVVRPQGRPRAALGGERGLSAPSTGARRRDERDSEQPSTRAHYVGGYPDRSGARQLVERAPSVVVRPQGRPRAALGAGIRAGCSFIEHERSPIATPYIGGTRKHAPTVRKPLHFQAAFLKHVVLWSRNSHVSHATRASKHSS